MQVVADDGEYFPSTGTYFILYDFMSYFNKDAVQCLARDKFLEIIDAIFPDRSPLEKEAIVFQVIIYIIHMPA